MPSVPYSTSSSSSFPLPAQNCPLPCTPSSMYQQRIDVQLQSKRAGHNQDPRLWSVQPFGYARVCCVNKLSKAELSQRQQVCRMQESELPIIDISIPSVSPTPRVNRARRRECGGTGKRMSGPSPTLRLLNTVSVSLALCLLALAGWHMQNPEHFELFSVSNTAPPLLSQAKLILPPPFACGLGSSAPPRASHKHACGAEAVCPSWGSATSKGGRAASGGAHFGRGARGRDGGGGKGDGENA